MTDLNVVSRAKAKSATKLSFPPPIRRGVVGDKQDLATLKAKLVLILTLITIQCPRKVGVSGVFSSELEGKERGEAMKERSARRQPKAMKKHNQPQRWPSSSELCHRQPGSQTSCSPPSQVQIHYAASSDWDRTLWPNSEQQKRGEGERERKRRWERRTIIAKEEEEKKKKKKKK